MGPCVASGRQAVRECGMREYVSRVCGAVRASDALRALGPGLPELLVAQLRAHLALHRYYSLV